MQRPASCLPLAPVFAIFAAFAASFSGCTSEGKVPREGIDVFPLYRDVSGADGSEFSVLWPLASSTHDAEKDVAWFFPFFLHIEHGEHGANGETMLFPFFPIWMVQRDADMQYEHVLPLWSRTYHDGRTDSALVLFLVEWSRQAGEDGLVAHSLFPAYQWVKGGPGNRLSLVRFGEMFPTGPLFSLLDLDETGVRREKDHDVPGSSIDFGGVFGRIVNVFHTADVGAFDETRFLTLFANETWSLFYHRAPHEGAPGADVDGGATTTRLFPLFSRTTSPTSSEWSGPLWMFGWKEADGKKTLTLFWIPIGMD